jgi:hypothetical protein
VLTDQGYVFLSNEFSTNCAALGINLRHTATESHNCLGTGERFHGPLRKIIGKLKLDHPLVLDAVRLAMAVHAMNITAGPEGIVPSLLVFGKLPKVPHVDSVPPNKADRLVEMHAARAAYEQILAQRRIAAALSKRPPPTSSLVFEPGQSVYVSAKFQVFGLARIYSPTLKRRQPGWS